MLTFTIITNNIPHHKVQSRVLQAGRLCAFPHAAQLKSLRGASEEWMFSTSVVFKRKCQWLHLGEILTQVASPCSVHPVKKMKKDMVEADYTQMLGFSLAQTGFQRLNKKVFFFSFSSQPTERAQTERLQ